MHHPRGADITNPYGDGEVKGTVCDCQQPKTNRASSYKLFIAKGLGHQFSSD